MKHLLVLITLSLSFFAAQAQSLGDLLGKIGGGGSGNDITNTIGGLVEDLTSSSNFKIEDIAGTWKYNEPAVSFKGDNALKNIGGSAAASAIENKLAPYYDRIGFKNMILTVNPDSTFSMALNKITLKGSIVKDNDGLSFVFDKLPQKPVRCMATKTGSKLNLTFDTGKLITVMETVSKYINVSSLKAVSSLLSSYDGMYTGFQLSKQQ